MKNMLYCIGLFFTMHHTVAVFLSVHSDFNSYVQVYDAMGSIIAADFVFPGKTVEANTGIIGLDRVRWLGSNKKVYEYRFDSAQVTQKNIVQIWKDNANMIDVNGVTVSLGEFQSRLQLLYE